MLFEYRSNPLTSDVLRELLENAAAAAAAEDSSEDKTDGGRENLLAKEFHVRHCYPFVLETMMLKY